MNRIGGCEIMLLHIGSYLVSGSLNTARRVHCLLFGNEDEAE